MTDIITIALNKLDADPKNVRKTYSKEGIEELAANIRSDGNRLLQNLVVRKSDKKGRFLVVAGERRRQALTLLAEAGEIAKDFAVECKEREADNATEISLAENIMREEMHPVDQYEAFKVMVDKGTPIADIAARFGATETVVRRRLALARVSAKLLDIYRNEEMSFEQLAAFTVSDDHSRQEEVWESLPSWNCNAHAIRQALQNEVIKATDKRITLIGGLHVYEAAGGAVRRDLFDAGNEGYATDVVLVERLVAEKLETEAERVREEGWKWVECSTGLSDDVFRMKRVYPAEVMLSDEQQVELDSLDAEYDELAELIEAGAADKDTEGRMLVINGRMGELQNLTEAYSSDDLEKAGAIVTIGYYGALRVERGFIRSEDEIEAAQLEANNASGGEAAPKGAKPFVHSQSLTQELTAQKTAALRVELARNPDIALAAVVHALLLKVAYTYPGVQSALEISLTTERLETSIKQPEGSKALCAFNDLRENYGYVIPGDPADLWEWCLEQPHDKLLDLLAYAAAHSVNAVAKLYDDRKSGCAHAEELGQALNVDMNAWFEPTAEGYFGRISKAGIAAVITEARGKDVAAGISGMKKGEAAAYAERQVSGTDWLPEPVRFVSIGPTSVRDNLEEEHAGDVGEVNDAVGGDGVLEVAE
jgi:ParB family chromosome partitioning protein